ncbi:hypothetical protein BBN63_19980 [Streptomyces niveus]|uniref:DNA methylase adenine-specific domain-containing protein n=2 Tax=Streptomyces niveus TaxID=193462 RepID=A0A1U9QV76_STRNV|nr:hypothetical protein BBN63_19980 [Streptomyces niveus]
MSDHAVVTSSDIARLAGVGRATVSNWRRRHADFPTPTGGSDTSPTFSLATVESWLRERGKLPELPLRERVWRLLQSADPGTPLADRLALVGLFLLYVKHSAEPRDPDPYGLRPHPLAQLSGWPSSAALPDDQLAAALPEVLSAIAPQLSDSRGIGGKDLMRQVIPHSLSVTLIPTLRAAAELASQDREQETFDYLCSRYLQTQGRPLNETAPQLADLLVDLVNPGNSRYILDPSCGTGELLLAAARAAQIRAEAEPDSGARRPEPRPLPIGVELDIPIARITALRLAYYPVGTDMHNRPTRGHSMYVGDGVKDDPHPGGLFRAVVSKPPFNQPDRWDGYLFFDRRWKHGHPPKTEPELTWVQNAIAHLEPGAYAAMVLPPAVASRAAGRRIRWSLVSSGALRAVAALPAGAAAPHGIGLHIWLLQRPPESGNVPREVLFVDASAHKRDRKTDEDRIDWLALRATVTDAWMSFVHSTKRYADLAGVCQVVKTTDLLDDVVDLTPTRHIDPPAEGGEGTIEQLLQDHAEVSALLQSLAPALPSLTADLSEGPTQGWATTTVADLARNGNLGILRGPTGTSWSGKNGQVAGDADGERALTLDDVLAGVPPTGIAPMGIPDESRVELLAGDVVVPTLALAGGATAVITEASGALLGPNLCALRVNPLVLDPWFLAGFLSDTGNVRRASFGSSVVRVDMKRLQVPLLSLAEQQHYGRAFRDLVAFRDQLRRAADDGGRYSRTLAQALTTGALQPAPLEDPNG